MEMPFAYKHDCDCDFCTTLRREARDEQERLAYKADREVRTADQVIDAANRRERT